MQHSVQSLSRLTGVSPARLRTWERRYGIPSPARTATGLRRYSADDIRIVQRMSELVSAGLPASEAAAAVRASGQLGQADYALPVPVAEPGVAVILEAIERFDRLTVGVTVREAVARDGWGSALETLVFPALRLAGDAWHEGRLTPAHEHFLTDALRSEIVAATIALPVPSAGRPLILACPEDEPHDVGIVALRLLLAELSIPVLFLGADLPVGALLRACAAVDAAGVVLSVASPAGFASLTLCARELASARPTLPIFAGGPAVAGQRDTPYSLLPSDLRVAARSLATRFGPKVSS